MSAKGLSSRAIIGAFYARLAQGAGGWAEPLSMYVGSDQESETYKWLGMSPVMREWVGGRQAKGFRENGITIANKPFEATLEVLVDELRRDKTGQILVRVNEMADRANAHWLRLLSALILNGGASVCYDGQYFFDTDHSEGDSGAQSNAISVDISALPVSSHGSIAAPSVGELNLAIMQAVQTIMSFKDDQGEPMNETAADFLVMVPTSLWMAAASALKSPVIDGGDTNVITSMDGFRINLRQNPRLNSWTSKFAVFRADGNVKPFIRQEEVPVQVSAIAEGSELEFKERKHQYGIYASGNAGYGYWQHAVQVELT